MKQPLLGEPAMKLLTPVRTRSRHLPRIREKFVEMFLINHLIIMNFV
jgi:hypothetical protein